MLGKLALILFLFSGRLAQSTDENDKNMHNLLVCIRQMEPNSKDTILKLPNSCEDLMGKVVDHWKLTKIAKQDHKTKTGTKVSSKWRTWRPWP